MWSSRVSLVLLGLLFGVALGKYSEELLVRLEHGGGVSGHFRTSHSGRGILAFNNIPFAEPPIGPLRFKDPVVKAPWTGYLPRNTEDIHCPQKQMFSRQKFTSGQEDCLVLHVYVPNIAPEKRANLPVMVYIHGGGFTVGSGSLSMLDPEFILDSDVILVTFNYRLGVLGFLSTFEGELTGNWGLKDQQLAMQWVQENIKSFGGDKEKVTLFGLSAGGASVGLQMMAPNSEGLFQRAIMMSGTSYDAWVLQDKQVAIKNAKKLFTLLGCDQEQERMKCLRNVKWESIMDTAYEFYEWDLDPLVPFGPVLELETSNTPFIREENLKQISNVPLIIGVTQNEGAFKAAILSDQKDLIADLESSKFDDILPSTLCYSHLEETAKREITEKIKQFYLDKEGGGAFNWARDKHAYVTIISDGMFVTGFDQFVQQRLQKKNTASTYVYVFNYHGATSFTDVLVESEEEVDWGVSHGDDSMYMFPLIKLMAPHRIMSQRDLEFGAKYVRILTDFAAYGDPVYTSEDLLWNPATAKFFDYMRIGNCNRESCPKGSETRSELLLNPFTERLNFWRELKKIQNTTSRPVKQQQREKREAGEEGRDEL